LFLLAASYEQIGKIQQAFICKNQASQILIEVGGLDALPIPQWQKSIAKFAQRGKLQLTACFVVGLVAFPFALVFIVTLNI
jgi:hypothetical protein